MNLQSIIKDASDFVNIEFNVSLVDSSLKIYSPDEWNQFCTLNKFNVRADGLYVPQSKIAYNRSNSPYLISNVFHELFGHGLFVEHSTIGKELSNIDKLKGDERAFLQNNINRFEQPLGICETNLYNYEGFAVWLEELLCKETNNEKFWNLKKEQPYFQGYLQLNAYFNDIEQQMGRFEFISQLGFPKYYDGNKIVDVMKKLYGTKFDSVEYMFLYGSRKPTSDIDVFVVSDNPSQNYFNGWLDVCNLHTTDFEKMQEGLDIVILDPLFAGEQIYGDLTKVGKIKQELKKAPLTSKVVNYTISRANEQKSYLLQFDSKDKQRKDCLGYIESYEKMAKLYSQGVKPLTLKELRAVS